MKRFVFAAAFASCLYGQVPTIANELFPQFRSDLNTSLGLAVSTSGAYASPSWITSFPWAKLTGVPTFYYQTLQSNGTPVAQRTKFNLAAGSNVTVTASDNGTDTTTFTVATTGAGGGATIPATANLINGDGAGNGANSGIAPANVVTQAANGASGGVPCYTGANKALVSSGALAANSIVIGGGAGACPTATTAIPNGTTATTQSQADSSAKVATTAYVDTGLAGKQGAFMGVTSLGLALSGSVTATDSGSTSIFTGTLTGNVTSFAPGGFVAGKTYYFALTEGGSGGFTITGVSGITGFPCLNTGTGIVNYFQGDYDGTTLKVTSSSNSGGFGCAPVGVAPTAPPSSGVFTYVDPNDVVTHQANPSTTFVSGSPTTGLGTFVLGLSNPADNRVVTYVDIHGNQQRAQVPFSNLSGSVAAGQMPALTGDTTSSAGSTTTVTGKVNGTTVPVNSAADQVLGTTASATGAWTSLPNCANDGAHALVYSTSTHLFACESVTGASGPPSFPVNPQTTTYQTLAGDFSACKTIPVASGTFTVTLVASGSQPANGQCIWVFNYGSGVVTIARSGQNINGAAANQTLGAASASSPTGAFVVSDGANYFVQTFGAGTGGGVATFSGDGTLISNSGSAGAVTATLATAGAHKFWGNNTGSTGAPGYDSITASDMYPTPVSTVSDTLNCNTTTNITTQFVPFAQTWTMPAFTQTVGASFRLKMPLLFTSTSTAVVWQYEVKIDSTVVYTDSAGTVTGVAFTNSASPNTFLISADATGSSGTVSVAPATQIGNHDTFAHQVNTTAPITLDTTVSHTVSLLGKCAAATAGNSQTLLYAQGIPEF